MDDRWQQVQQLFAEARQLPEAERAAWLGRATGDDSLRDEVLELLAAEPGSTAFLAPPELAATVSTPTPVLEAGTRLGGFEVRRVLASGGMGTVYVAEQDNPHRTVALKVIGGGMASDRARDRFALEVDVLARLEHPGVASVFGAGVESVETAAGRSELPWFAMELVDGARTIIDEADQRGLSIEQRVELALEVCDAVHHAHQRGVIHRDLKPGNILVDSQGHAKVIDFGLALVTQDERASLTETGHVVGTLASMSPEQLAGSKSAVDVRTDVYALGVVVYELLTGSRPHDLGALGLMEAARVVTLEPPTRPSVHFPELSRDLEAIVLHCLEKLPEHRYPSVAALGADLRRWLQHEPIEARPPSVTDQLRLFARRHRAVVTSAVAVLLVLVAATIVSLRYAFVAEEARGLTSQALDRARDGENAALAAARRADREATRASEGEAAARAAEARTRELFDELFEFAATTVADAERGLTGLAGTGEVREDLLAAVQARLQQLDAFSPGRPQVRRALGGTMLHRARLMGGFGGEFDAGGDVAGGAALLDRALEVLGGELLHDDQDVELVRRLVRGLLVSISSKIQQGDADGARADAQRARALCRSLPPEAEPYPADQSSSNGYLAAAVEAEAGGVHSLLGEHELAYAATRAYAEHLEQRLAAGVGGPGTRDNLGTANYRLGLSLAELGRFDEALAATDRSDELRTSLLDDPAIEREARFGLAVTAVSRSSILRKAGRHEQALAASTKALATWRELIREDPNNSFLVVRLALVVFEQGRNLQQLERWAEADNAYAVVQQLYDQVPGMVTGPFAEVRDKLPVRRAEVARHLKETTTP